MTPTARTLEMCRRNGWYADVVERWIPGANIRRDLFGCIDIVAMSDQSMIGIQATSAANVSSRVSKIKNKCTEPALIWLLHAELQVWGWRKYPRRDSSGRSWRPRIEHITAEMLD